MKKGYGVLGLGKFGKSIALTLAASGEQVLVIDQDEERVHEVADEVTYAVQGDAGDEETLQSLGIGNLDCVIIAIADDIEASVMATIIVKEMGVRYVIARAQNEVHKKILDKVGADKVILPEKEMGTRIARNLVTGNFLDLVELSSVVSMVQMTSKSEWIGKSIRELDFRGKYKLNVVAVKKGDDIMVTPDPDKIIGDDCTLILAGKNVDLQKLV